MPSSVNVIDWPPKNWPMSGVMNVKRPVTVTYTESPRAGTRGGQVSVEQVRETSAGSTVTKLPLASFRARHMIRLLSLLALVQAVLGMNEPGLRAASRAPSRAASLTVICE